MRSLLALAALLAITTTATDADARRRRGGGKKYVANGVFGAGLELGAPAGLNGKYFLSDSGALNFGIGWIGDYYYSHYEGPSIYLDYLWHPVSLANPPEFQLPLFVGIGGRFWSLDDDRFRDDDGISAFGLRVPFGIAMDLNNTPLDFYLQLTFVIDFFRNYPGDDHTHSGLEASIGFRYWFN